MRPILLVLLLALPVHGGTFVAPDESKALFRRDQLPIDTDTMRSLAEQLATLARREMGDAPAQWRATSQILAVAMRLDPANRPAREIGPKLLAGEPVPPPGNPRLAEAKSETWHILDWLLQPEAGSDGQLLGHQLLDALHIIDPAHPSSKRYDAAGEAGRWQGIVAEIARFGAAAKDPPEGPPQPAPPTGEKPREDPTPPPPPVDRPPIQLQSATIKTPFLLYDKDYKQHLVVTPLTMNLLSNEEAGELTFALTPEFQSPILDTARERVRTSLQQTWSNLPVQSIALLSTSKERYASRNGTAITGPASLLLHAAISGKTLRDDVVFIADIEVDGSLTRPKLSWDYLRLIRTQPGGRLIVPPDLQAELRSFLVLQDPGFFLRWEVLVVSSMDAALSLASVGGDPEGLAAAVTLFKDVQRVSEGKDAGQVSVNTHVRERLAQIQQKAPFHLSASMMLLQGSSKRPTRLEREVLARIIRSAIEPLSSVSRAETATVDPDRLDAIFAATRRNLEPFAKYVGKNDLALHTEALNLANLVRSMARSKRLAAKAGSTTAPDRNASQLNAAHDALKAGYPKYLNKLAPYTGETVTP